MAYAYYRDNEPLSAVAACDRFIKLHPQHPNVDYAYYLKGLANFVEDQSFGQVQRPGHERGDPKAAREASRPSRTGQPLPRKQVHRRRRGARMKYLVNALAAQRGPCGPLLLQAGATWPPPIVASMCWSTTSSPRPGRGPWCHGPQL